MQIILQKLDMMIVGRCLHHFELMFVTDDVQCVAVCLLLLELHHSQQVIFPKVLHHLVALVFQSGLAQTALVDLSPVDVLLHTTSRYESVDYDVSFLAYAVDTVYALVVIGRIPVRVEDDSTISSNQI